MQSSAKLGELIPMAAEEEKEKEASVEKVKEGVEKVGKSVLAQAGFWGFLIGVIIALFAGIVLGAGIIDVTGNAWGYIASTLAALGFIVGVTSALGLGTITKEEVPGFLTAAVAVVVVGVGSAVLSSVPLVGPYLGGVTLAMLVFFAPAAVIIALKALWDIGKEV